MAREPRIFVISGPSGTGKGTIVERLLADDPALWLSRSWTTRSRRPSEAPTAYHFVDRPAFEQHIASGGFLEWAEVFGNLYGTPVPEAPRGSDVLLEIDVQGARQVVERYPEAVLIFVRPPSREVQESRLRTRGDDDATIAKRLAKADAEEDVGRRIATHTVVNDDLDRAVAEVAGIVEVHRFGPPQRIDAAPSAEDD